MSRLAVFCCLFLGLTLGLEAGAISTGVWYQFSFPEPNSVAAGCDPADPAGDFCFPSSGTPTVFADAPPWTISLAAPLNLLVTDAFESGLEYFRILDFGNEMGFTTKVTPGTDCGDDPVPCFANSGMSNGTFTLGAGAHSLAIEVLVPAGAAGSPGTGYFALVPEPGAGLLAASGLTILAIGRALKKRVN